MKKRHFGTNDAEKGATATTNYERIKTMSKEEMEKFLTVWAMVWAVDFVLGKAPMNVKKWLDTETENG